MVKLNITLEQAMKNQRDGYRYRYRHRYRYSCTLSLTSALDGFEWLMPRPTASPPDLARCPEPVSTEEENLAHTEIRPPDLETRSKSVYPVRYASPSGMFRVRLPKTRVSFCELQMVKYSCLLHHLIPRTCPGGSNSSAGDLNSSLYIQIMPNLIPYPFTGAPPILSTDSSIWKDSWAHQVNTYIVYDISVQREYDINIKSIFQP